MRFKEWLELNEGRFKGFRRLFQQQNPDMPKYVQNDLYNSRAAHALGKVINAKNSSNPTAIQSQTPIQGSNSTASQTMLNRWASTRPTEIASKLKGDLWNKHPETLNVTPAHFTEKTQWYFLDRRFGYREEKQIRNDGERTNFQRQAMNSATPGTNEPVIVRHTPHGYELLEGWHRTMNLLLKGAPPEQIAALQQGYQTDIDFSQWQPVVIKAYVSLSKETQDANAGTGDYIPQSDSQGTGFFVPSMS